MFLHNYIYRLKCILRDRHMIFWTLLFPVILAILFDMALSNISNIDDFEKINLAIVLKSESEENTAFLEAADDTDLFNITDTSEAKANDMLNNNQVDGVILFDESPQILVSQSGINQTIIKSFVDQYLQITSTLTTIISDNPQALNSGLIDSISDQQEYLSEVTPSRNAPDQLVNYFYTLIAMACLYGGFLGVKEITALQADLSDVGARVSVVPTNKVKLFLSSILATATVQLGVITLLMCFLIFVLQVNFGDQLAYIALTCLVGSLTGVTFGAFIAAVVKREEGVKMGILIGSTMAMSFLAGMMVENMKYMVSKNLPILSYLNPATLITDSFYALYYYPDHSKFYLNIAILCVFIAVFLSMTFFVIRRQKYASL
ncbi:MAG: linearmycin/streptolysin transport system permease protein [Eubacteriaceae bacterium]|nr:linearmycin/streptolysin transport system permease protein [Eubacteriaceae bacterium]